MSVDMDMVAARAGVSRTTVHRALSGKAEISENTRQRVLAVARELGYRRNGRAASFRQQSTGTLGFVTAGLNSPLWAALADEIEKAAQSRDQHLVLSCSRQEPETERDLVRGLLEKGVDGLMVCPADLEENADFFNTMNEEGVALVFVDRFMPGVNVDAVATDNLLGGYLAGRHLIGLGRTQVAFLPTPERRSRRLTSVQSRLNGLNRALAEAGIPPAPVLGLDLPDMEAGDEFGYLATQAYLEQGASLDGLFSAFDWGAAGAVDALLDRGLQVPLDVSVVGFNDEHFSPRHHLELTSVRQPLPAIATEAVRLLLARIKDGDNLLPRQRVMLEPSLIIRDSCGGVPAG